jgi:hypothetical protein
VKARQRKARDLLLQQPRQDKRDGQGSRLPILLFNNKGEGYNDREIAER